MTLALTRLWGRLTSNPLINRTILITGSILGVVLAVWLFIFIVGHIPPPVTHGTVIEKRDTPAHSERYQSGTVCYSYNKEGSCTYSQPVYSQRYVAESWQLRLSDCSASPKPDGTVECRTGWVSVDEQTYDQTDLNTTYGEK